METFVLAAVVGVVVGVLSGLLGIGGGTIMVPVFRLVLSLEPIMATATSLFTIVPTSLSGLFKHMRNKTLLPALGVLCGVAGACMSPVGVWLATKSANWMIMLGAACVMTYSAVTMFRKALAKPAGKKTGKGRTSRAAGQGNAQDAGESKAEGAAAARFTDSAVGSNPAAAAVAGSSSTARRPASPVPAASCAMATNPEAFMGATWRGLTVPFAMKAVAIGLVAGLLGGYVGVGGGFIMIPLFMSLLGVPMKLASGTSLTAVCILSLPGVAEQAMLGNINYAMGIAMAAGSIPGALLGASLVKYVPERALRLIFACFLTVMAVIMVLNEIGFIG